MQLASPKSLPVVDRPREKLQSKGARALSDIELLQVILGAGTKQAHVGLLAAGCASHIHRQTEDQQLFQALQQEKGMTANKAMRVIAALELGRRRVSRNQLSLLSPGQIAVLTQDLCELSREHLVSITLDGAGQFISRHLLSIGTLTNTLVHPREVFAPALIDRAAMIVLVHNHPANLARPSHEDVVITHNLVNAGKLLGVEMWDHLIVTRSAGWYSFREAGQLGIE